ncbi:MAG: VWA domain-containing protein [Candidatus Absconditabacteria bacterium]
MNIGNINISTFGVYLSGILILFFILLFFIKKYYSPNYFVPFKVINKKYYIFEKILIVLIMILLILIPLDLNYRAEKKLSSLKTLNIQILFDVSLSMTADDISPSRFVGAKESVTSLVKDLDGYNISMITFSGIPFVRMPFSNENEVIVPKLGKMLHSDFPPADNFVGTAIGDAILLGMDNLLQNSQDEKFPGVIILLTDGDSNKGSRPEQVSKISKNKNIPIYTLGIGQSDYLVGKDYFDNEVNTTINIPLLETISKNSGGKFYRVLTQQDFNNIFKEIEQIIKSKELPNVYYEYKSLNIYFSQLLILLLIISITIKGYLLVNLYDTKNKKG